MNGVRSDTSRGLRSGLLTVIWLTILLGAPSAATVAQDPGSLVLRAGATFSPHVSGVFETDLRVWRAVSLVAAVRGVRTGFGCAGTTVSPCVPDGLSLGLGARVTADSPWSWSLFAEGAGGAHGYESDSWHPFIEGAAGFTWPLGSAGVFEVGANLKRIGASRFSTVQPNYGVVPGSAHHVVSGLLVKLGLSVR